MQTQNFYLWNIYCYLYDYQMNFIVKFSCLRDDEGETQEWLDGKRQRMEEVC